MSRPNTEEGPRPTPLERTVIRPYKLVIHRKVNDIVLHLLGLFHREGSPQKEFCVLDY